MVCEKQQSKPRSHEERYMACHASFPLAMSAIPAVIAVAASSSSQFYPNVTLQSSVMSATVFVPMGDDRNNNNYYVGSRFDHGSMIGDVVFGGKGVYGRELWRMPHVPTNPESGLGLASEFGCGEDGARCVGKGDITNGVLGYETAKVGEPFLKIGVGALVKGSCPKCGGNENDDYKFNSPYKFHRAPTWEFLPSPSPNEISFVSEETLGDFGYRIQKTIRLDGNVMTVRSLLTNLGKQRFTTPWYSHHFFTVNAHPVGPGYSLDLGLSEYALETQTPQFIQPGLKSWSGDITEYANVTMASDKSISIRMNKAIPRGVRLKAEFLYENTVTSTDGSFTLHSPDGISVFEKIPELQTQSRNPFMFAYNVYAERGTISPEPMLLLYLNPGETTFWTQHLKFTSNENAAGSSAPSMFTFKAWQNPFHVPFRFGSGMFIACLGVVIASFYKRLTGSRKRFRYSSIPDHPLRKENQESVLSEV